MAGRSLRKIRSTPPESPRFDPAQVISILTAHAVDFVIIGGTAANLQGAALVTDDIDIIYRFEPGNLERLASALPDLGAESITFPGLATGDWAALLTGSDLWRWRTRFGVVDMMTWASGAPRDFDELKSRSDIAEVAGNPVHVASLEDLIAMKRTAGRPADASKLLELQDLSRLRAQLDH